MDSKTPLILSKQEYAALSKEAQKSHLDTSAFDALKPEEIARARVTKAAFFELHPLLPKMTREGAAEQTYDQWLTTKRIVEERVVTEDPTGLSDDKVEVYIPARYVNSERRRHNVNKRRAVEHSQATGLPLPADFR